LLPATLPIFLTVSAFIDTQSLGSSEPPSTSRAALGVDGVGLASQSTIRLASRSTSMTM